MKRTNRYPKGRTVPNPASTLYKAPDHAYRREHPLAINATHARAGKHPIPYKVRAKIAYAMKRIPMTQPEELVVSNGQE